MKVYIYNKKTKERFEVVQTVQSIELRYGFYRIIFVDELLQRREAIFSQEEYQITMFGY